MMPDNGQYNFLDTLMGRGNTALPKELYELFRLRNNYLDPFRALRFARESELLGSGSPVYPVYPYSPNGPDINRPIGLDNTPQLDPAPQREAPGIGFPSRATTPRSIFAGRAVENVTKSQKQKREFDDFSKKVAPAAVALATGSPFGSLISLLWNFAIKPKLQEEGYFGGPPLDYAKYAEPNYDFQMTDPYSDMIDQFSREFQEKSLRDMMNDPNDTSGVGGRGSGGYGAGYGGGPGLQE